MLPRLARIVGRHEDTPDTFTLELELEEGRFLFGPGQFNMVYVHGVGEVPLSISGGDGVRFRHTTRSVGTVTRALAGLKVGDAVGVRGPYGSEWPVAASDGCDVVVVAGGIGLAPLCVAVEQLRERTSGRRLSVFLGARSPDDLLYPGLRRDWDLDERVHFRATVDRGAPGWKGPVGVVTRLLSGRGFDATRAVAMICGPEIMMWFTVRTLLDLGMAEDRIYLSMERNMKCAVGFCGHCQFGSELICRDGAVFRWDRIARWMAIKEI